MKTERVIYHDDDATFEAYVAFDDKNNKKRPAVLIAHDWSGRNDFACKKADDLAKLGYVGIALDVYGQGVLGKNNEEKMHLMKPLVDDRAKLQRRLLAGFDAARLIKEVDEDKIAVIGFCFGGLCALDLARTGADLRGVATFHGFFNEPVNVKRGPIKAKVLAVHGYEDPMVKADQVAAFEKEMTEAKIDWQLHIFGNVKHAFTNPQANDQQLGLIYNEVAAKRSWTLLQGFLTEVFA